MSEQMPQREYNTDISTMPAMPIVETQPTLEAAQDLSARIADYKNRKDDEERDEAARRRQKEMMATESSGASLPPIDNYGNNYEIYNERDKEDKAKIIGKSAIDSNLKSSLK